LIGAYSLNNGTTDVYIAVIFSLVGLLMKKFAFEPAPLVLAFVLGPLLETTLRRSLILSDGSLILSSAPRSQLCRRKARVSSGPWRSWAPTR
jgi:TctA family transporter